MFLLCIAKIQMIFRVTDADLNIFYILQMAFNFNPNCNFILKMHWQLHLKETIG